MALKKNEKNLVEALKNFLQQDAKLGLAIHDNEETSHNIQFQWEGINDAFRLAINESPFHDSISSAFYAIHSFKYLDDPLFELDLKQELLSRAIPKEEINKTMNIIHMLRENIGGSKKTDNQIELFRLGDEKSSGWNEQLKELADLTNYTSQLETKQSKPFTGGGPNPQPPRK